jgi:phospholipid-binding lipoprotein MlaA
VTRTGELGIISRAAALALVSALSACSSGAPFGPSPHLLGSLPNSGSPSSASARIDAPTDVAALPTGSNDISDPFEKMNRSVFSRNQRLNHAIVYPVAKAYNRVIPKPVRNSVANFADNLSEPMVFANNVLQLRLGAAATTAGRFALNSSIGIGGLFDIANRENLQRQTGDFGQTLYVWGVRRSAYLVVPIIGPTNVRDLIGTTVDFVAAIPAGGLLQEGLEATQFASAANDLTVAGSIATPFTKLDEVEQMKTLEDSSLDFYTMLRSVVAQKRQAELDEAVARSGWTALRYSKAAPRTSSRPSRPASPKQSEIMASALTGPD